MEMIGLENTKICKSCGKKLPLEDFHKDKNGYLGRKAQCKKCKSGKKKNIVNGIEVFCEYCNKPFKKNKYAYEHSEHHFCSRECKDKYQEKEVEFICDYCGEQSTMIPYRFNRCKKHFCSNECKNAYQDGKNHPRYDSSISEEDRNDKRQYSEYYQFRYATLERDNYICQSCGQRGDILVVHHLNGYHWFKEGRTDPDNAVTLCEECHRDFHNIYGNRNNTKEQYENWVNIKDTEVS